MKKGTLFLAAVSVVLLAGGVHSVFAQTIAQYEQRLMQCEGVRSDECANVIYTLGSIYSETNRQSSLQMFWRLVREYPTFGELPDAFLTMVNIYTDDGHLDTAQVIFLQLNARFPDSPRTLEARSRLEELGLPLPTERENGSGGRRRRR